MGMTRHATLLTLASAEEDGTYVLSADTIHLIEASDLTDDEMVELGTMLIDSPINSRFGGTTDADLHWLFLERIATTPAYGSTRAPLPADAEGASCRASEAHRARERA